MKSLSEQYNAKCDLYLFNASILGKSAKYVWRIQEQAFILCDNRALDPDSLLIHSVSGLLFLRNYGANVDPILRSADLIAKLYKKVRQIKGYATMIAYALDQMQNDYNLDNIAVLFASDYDCTTIQAITLAEYCYVVYHYS